MKNCIVSKLLIILYLYLVLRLHQTSDTLHIPGTQQLFLVYKWHWYKV